MSNNEENIIEDEKPMGIGSILRIINNQPSKVEQSVENPNEKQKFITLQNLKENKVVQSYFDRVELVCSELGMNKHDRRHAEYVALSAGEILKKLGYPSRDVHLAEIAGYLHDLGYLLDVENHSFIGAGIAYQLLKDMNAPQEEIDKVCLAIAYNGHGTMNNIAAALSIADASDFNKSRTREEEFSEEDEVLKRIISNQIIIDTVDKFIKLDLKFSYPSSTDKKDFMLHFSKKCEYCHQNAIILGYTFNVYINGEKVF